CSGGPPLTTRPGPSGQPWLPALAATHLPVLLQVMGATHSGTSSPLLTVVQVPVAQLWQGLSQALLQQTPSVQKPLAHSPAPAQPEPVPLLPCGTSVPASRTRGLSVPASWTGGASAAASWRSAVASAAPPSPGQPVWVGSARAGQSSIASGTPSPSPSDGKVPDSARSNVPPENEACGIFEVPSSTSTPPTRPRRSIRRSPATVPGWIRMVPSSVALSATSAPEAGKRTSFQSAP